MKTIRLACICLLVQITSVNAQLAHTDDAGNEPLPGSVGIGTLHPTSFKLEVAGNTGPEADTVRDLGSPAKRWANLYAMHIRGTIYPSAFSSGGLVFADSAGRLAQNSSLLYWDITHNSLGIGVHSVPAGYSLAVKGGIIAEKLRLKLLAGGWPDYVFAQDYPLLSLQDLDHYIQTNKHLPGIPPAAVMEQEGMEMNSIAVRLTEKIEELTLYILHLNKEIVRLKQTCSSCGITEPPQDHLYHSQHHPTSEKQQPVTQQP